jgi:rod shape-determining protein MreD
VRAARAGAALTVVLAALVLQVSVLPHLAWQGVVPNVTLLVVVACSLSQGETFGMMLGFAAGLALDLAPPADHLAGRWALALVLVGYVAGRVRADRGRGVSTVLATVAACSFLGTSVFALTGLLLDDLHVAVPGLLQVVGLALVLDLLVTPVVVPVVVRLLDSFDVQQVVV